MEQSAGNQASWSGSSGTDSAMEQAKEQTRDVMQNVSQSASELAGKAREQIRTQASQQKERAAESLHTVAQAFRDTGGHLQQQEPLIGNCMRSASDVAESLSGYLREHEVDDMVRDVENFARRQPALVLGGALVLGFLAARFVKSSAPSANGGWGEVPESYTGTSRHPDWMVEGHPTRREREGYGRSAYTGGGTVYAAGAGGHTMPSGYQGYGSPTTGTASPGTEDETDDLTFSSRGESDRGGMSHDV